MIPNALVRRQSQPKRQPVAQKIITAELLLNIITYQQIYNISHTLFGYTLATINIPLNDKFVYDLKGKFGMMQDLFISKMLERQSITLIVVDIIQTFRITVGSVAEKQGRMMEVLGFNLEESIVNYNYIKEKWNKQAEIEQENRQNQRAFKKFLEQEAAEYKRKAQQADAEGWQCPVCICQIDKSNFGILECSHIFHPECIASYLKTKIDDGETQIACPLEGCGKILDVSDIYQFADPALKEKFQKFSFNKFVQKDGTTAWCPTAGCTAVFQFEQGLDNYRCPACSKHYCLKCKCLYHTGMTCAEYKINNTFSKDDADFIQFVRGAKFKQCPKCNYWVERAEGCSTMTCKCGQQFCYVCGGTTCPHGMCANPPKGQHIDRPRPILRRPVLQPKVAKKKR